MFGGRKRRVEKLSAGAARNLESGESIRELVQTQTGQSAARNARAVMSSEAVSATASLPYRSKVNAGPHILVATNRNLYAMKLSGGRLLDVGEVVMREPLDQADLRQEKRAADLRGHHVQCDGPVRRARRPPLRIRVPGERGERGLTAAAATLCGLEHLRECAASADRAGRELEPLDPSCGKLHLSQQPADIGRKQKGASSAEARS
jgi:hypothetical protein